MNKSNPSRPTPIPPQRAWQRALPAVIACLATLLALPIQAVTIPDLPLQTGSAYPPANIRFILDDTGSMLSDYMPDQVPATSTPDVSDQAYTRNTLYYNPATSYLPWATSTAGTRMSGGDTYASAYSDANLASGSTTDLAGATRTYYVPKSGANPDVGANYYRYQILRVGGTLKVVRSEYLAAPPGSTWNNQNINKGAWWYGSIVVPNGAASLDIAASNGSGGNADLYVRLGANPTTATYDARDVGNGNNQSLSIANPAAGTWYIGVYNSGNAKVNNEDISAGYSYSVGVSGAGCSTASGWLNCTYATPTGRSEAAEMKNFAIWYSYHRTRMKVAKAGASEAFSQLGSNVRVGYDSVWNRSPYDIPVATDGGLFRGSNRDSWYSRMQAAQGNGATPLHDALWRAGQYFSSAASSGPWGPASGAEQLSCRQNFALLTTDGYWNTRNRGLAAGAYGGDSDSTAGPLITSPTGETYQYDPLNPLQTPYRDRSSPARSDTLADVAMYYWKRDLRAELDNNVPPSQADPAFWQHMVTFGISIGAQGVLNPKTDLPSLSNGSLKWPDPELSRNSGSDAITARIDDLWHAAVNGRGSFVTANNPREFTQGLLDALAIVAARLGSASNVTANSTSFQSDTRVYQASYVSGKWIGELAAYDASSAGIATSPAWRASTLIPATGRTIVTWNGSTGSLFPTASQTSALVRSSGLAPVTGAQNAAYLGGDQTLEKRNGGTLRDRSTVLGDITNSSPLYVKDSETIFVGANDGMLHAFNALTGVERFAYVPGGINLADLSSLSDPQYTHRYFVDGPIAVSSYKQTPGKNYLVGALGRGGKGVFGLDVTTPGSFSTSSVLWERSSGANMGQVLGEPVIVKLNDGSNGVLVSNGINSSSGNATLFILSLTDGSILKELDTGVGGDNGLSAPRGWDNDGNGTVDYVYAGDLKGNLWKFDLTSGAASGWNIANAGAPMFVARDAADNRQPITAGLALAKEPSTGKRWVFIGTGSYMTTSDGSDYKTQSMYGVIDDGTVVSGRTSGGDGSLVKRQIVEAGTSGGKPVRGFEAATTLADGKLGWYVDLLSPPGYAQQGERIVTNPRVRGTVLLTASIIPPTTNSCDAGGTGYINALDAFTGASLASPYFDANGNGDFSDDKIGSPAVPIGSIDLGIGMPTLPTIIDRLLVVGGSTGGMGQVKVNPQGSGARRLSWREILKD